MKAYLVPDSTGMVKLDAMENPYPLPEALRARIGELVGGTTLNRYPDPTAAEVKERLRDALEVPPGADLIVGNGSDELILVLALVAGGPGAVVLGMEPSFVMFRRIATYAGSRYVGVDLREDFGLDIERTLAAIERYRPGLVILCYPNNPTGNLFDEELVTRIIEAAPGMVVMDEAYHAFAGKSFAGRLGRHSNLLVLRTLSKLGLAGIRLGAVMGPSAWLKELDKVRLPYNVNTLTQIVACEALQHGAVLTEQAAAIKLERGRMLGELARVPGITAYSSDANFILFKAGNADRVFEGLKSRGVLIKNLHGSHRLLENCLRVTVGTPDENGAFLTALNQSVTA